MAKLIRVLMLANVESWGAGEYYNLAPELAEPLIAIGKAKRFEPARIGPSEIKPAGPSEIKQPKKKLSSSR